MKKVLVLFLLAFICAVTFAQENKTSFLFNLISEQKQQGKIFKPVLLFRNSAITPSAQTNASLSSKKILALDKQASTTLFNDKTAFISLSVSTAAGASFTLELLQQNINSTGDFSFGTLEGSGTKKMVHTQQGLHYRGCIAGDPSSIACLSVFENGDVMGIFCNKDGNYNIGKNGAAGEYILYNSRDLTAPLKFECATSEVPPHPGIAASIANDPPLPSAIPPPLLCNKVRIYWEADYKLYNNNFAGNLINTSNYLTGVFNQVSTMYQNEGVLIELTDTYVWITADPYNTSTSSNGLAGLKNRWNGLGNTFKADLAVLIDGSPTNNGGVAYLLSDDLCDRDYAYGYADVYGTFNTVPVYSWDVEVLTHEMGHMMGSHHTHWCGWNTGTNGLCGAIDDCYSTESGSGCTTCSATASTNPIPPDGFHGTVMSYCHLRSGIGINLANGFGPLPQAAIRTTISGATCPVRDNKWTGAISTAWENAANWGCGLIPDINTDVTIASGLPRYPIVNSAAFCRRLIQAPSTNVLVKTGFTLMVAGPPANP